jgi:tRNA(Ile)-lysidine synthase
MSRAPLVNKLARALQGLGGVEEGLVLAVSGGPDSVALLTALVELRPASAGPLLIAHFNHRLRGADSDEDEAFVRRLHDGLARAGGAGLMLRSTRVDVAGRAQTEKGNLESTARRLRYAWLAEVAQEFHLARVATGHTADDQAETVLHHLLRGTGLKGLRGIAPRRPLNGCVAVIRPLLQATRREVLEYLRDRNQEYRHDRSNEDLRFTRNRIRHELLPNLESYNPAIRSVLARLAEQARAAYALEQDQARALLAAAELPRAGRVLVLDRRRLAQAPRHLLRAMFRLIWERELWPVGRMRYADWDRLADLALGHERVVDLPRGTQARCHERVVQLECR